MLRMNDYSAHLLEDNAYEQRLSIEVTNHCNHRCSHCFVRAANVKKRELTFQVAKDVITEGYDLNYRYLHITGGEPLLWTELTKALDYAYYLGYKKVLINTNGTILTDRIIRRYSELKGLSISISLQGPEFFHDRIRGKGSFQRALQGIQKVHDAGIDLYIFTTVSKPLLPMLPRFAVDIFHRFPSIGCLTFIQLIRVQDDVFDLTHELLDPDEFIRLVHIVALLNISGRKTEILNNPLSVAVSEMLNLFPIPASRHLCQTGNIIVMANRDISLAHSTRMSFGEYNTGVLEKVLSSAEYQEVTWPDEEACSLCEYYVICRKAGMIRPSEWFRDMNSEIPYCKRVLDKARTWF